jgi:hypothetical protein
MESLNACKASSIVLVTPGSAEFNLSFNNFVVDLISPQGRWPENLDGNKPSVDIPHLPSIRELRLAPAVSPNALIIPTPVTKILLNEKNLFGSVLCNVLSNRIEIHQNLATFFRILDVYAIFPGEQNNQFDGINGIQTQALSK